MRRLLLAAAGAALAAGFAPPRPVSRITRLHDTDDEDAADLAFLGRAMKAKKKNASFRPPRSAPKTSARASTILSMTPWTASSATARRISRGKRKSNFYGADDPMKSDGRGGDRAYFFQPQRTGTGGG